MCVTANLVSRIPSLRFTPADYESIRSDTDYASRTHGSSDSLRHWVIRGFYMSKVGGCNTWTVGSSWVS